MTTTRRRSGAILAGIGALLAMAAILIAIPAALWAFGGNPIPTSPINWDQISSALLHDDQGVLFLGTLRLVGWLAWASFAAPLLIDIVTSLGRIQTPRLPGLRFQQRKAAALTAAVATMLSVGAATTATAATAAPHAPAQAPAPATLALDAPAQTTPGRHITVERGDTLWGIAAHELGRGDAYPDLVEASADTTQPGGARLTDPDHIEPGWTITIPTTADASPTLAKASSPTPQAATPHRLLPNALAPTADPSPPTAATPTVAPTTIRIPTPAVTPATPAAAPSATAPDSDTPATSISSTQRAMFTAGGLSALTAAGVLTLLHRRRRAQSRHRTPGTRTPTPTGPAALTEAQLRVAADAPTVDHLDRALRTLARIALEASTPMPEVRAARITPTALELYLVDDTTELTTPFRRVPDSPATWELVSDDLAVILTPADAARVPAPCPALVPLGADADGGHLLINLETVGALHVTGDTQTATDTLAALAVSLLASQWADDLTVTLVGMLPDLPQALGSGRADTHSDIDTVLTDLEHAATTDRAALREEHVDSVASARLTELRDDAWAPRIVLIATPLSEEQQARLTEILTTTPRVAVAALTGPGAQTGPWSLTVTPTTHNTATGVLDPVDITLTVQTLPDDAYQATLALFQSTEAPPVEGPTWAQTLADDLPVDELPAQHPDLPLDGDPAEDDLTDRPQILTLLEPVPVSPLPTNGAHLTKPANTAPGHDTPTPQPDPSTDDRLTENTHDEPTAPTPIPALPDDAPIVRLLGDVHIDAAPGPKPGSPGRAAEIIAYLALHPGRSVGAFSAAIFPGERADGGKLGGKRNGYLRQARSWLGTNPDGRPYVGLVPDIGYALDPSTAVDWWLFQDLIGPDISHTPAVMLEAALRLVDGQPLTFPVIEHTGDNTLRYAWADDDQRDMIATIADVAHELATRALAAGDSRLAGWAAQRGLLVEPVSEALWRARIKAAHQSGRPDTVDGLVESMHRTLDEIDGELDDDTRHLIAQIARARHAHAGV